MIGAGIAGLVASLELLEFGRGVLLLDPSSPGLAALPNLTTNAFSAAKTNGANANLTSSEKMNLVDSNGSVIAAPSNPNATLDGFNLCSWATTC